MDEPAHEPEIDERLADLRRRRAEAVDVLAETLLDMYLQGRRAAREGRPWPPALATAPAPKPRPVKLPKGPPRRVHRFAEQQDLEVVRVLLAATWFPSAELDEQLGGGRRLCVVLELGGVIIGAAVLDEHGDVGVLRALSIDPPYRRRRHGTALAAFVIRLAYEHGLGSVYAAAASQWFLEEVGFQHIERVLLPRAALHLPSLAKVPAAAYIFEITPSVNGTRTPRRMVPRTLSELLAQPDRVPADTTGPRARRKRQQETENERDDAPTTR